VTRRAAKRHARHRGEGQNPKKRINGKVRKGGGSQVHRLLNSGLLKDGHASCDDASAEKFKVPGKRGYEGEEPSQPSAGTTGETPVEKGKPFSGRAIQHGLPGNRLQIMSQG